MTVDRPFDPAALDEFIGQLEQFRKDCGRPGLRKIHRTSRLVVQQYGKQHSDLSELSLATLSSVLNRRRVRPPEWPWVACFVLTCRHCAVSSGLEVYPREVAVLLLEWNARLQSVYTPRAQDPQRSTPPAGSPAGQAGDPSGRARHRRAGAGPSADASPPDTRPPKPGTATPLAAPTPSPAQQRRTRPGGAPPPRAPAPEHRPDAPTALAELEDYVGDRDGRVSLTTQRMFALYGQYGPALLHAAEDQQDPQACFRLGVLLCLDGHPNESLAWLMKAEAQGHAGASRLIEQPAPTAQAAASAYRIGRSYAVAGDRDTAALYLERATGSGHSEAAFELATLWMDHPARAVHWFTRAAERGHTLGRWWADEVRRQHRPRGTGAPPDQASRDDPRDERPSPYSRDRLPRLPRVPTLDEILEQVRNEQDPRSPGRL